MVGDPSWNYSVAYVVCVLYITVTSTRQHNTRTINTLFLPFTKLHFQVLLIMTHQGITEILSK